MVSEVGRPVTPAESETGSDGDTTEAVKDGKMSIEDAVGSAPVKEEMMVDKPTRRPPLEEEESVEPGMMVDKPTRRPPLGEEETIELDSPVLLESAVDEAGDAVGEVASGWAFPVDPTEGDCWFDEAESSVVDRVRRSEVGSRVGRINGKVADPVFAKPVESEEESVDVGDAVGCTIEEGLAPVEATAVAVVVAASSVVDEVWPKRSAGRVKPLDGLACSVVDEAVGETVSDCAFPVEPKELALGDCSLEEESIVLDAVGETVSDWAFPVNPTEPTLDDC